MAKIHIYTAGPNRCTVDVDGRRTAIIINEGGRWWLRHAASSRMDDFRQIGLPVDVDAFIHDTDALHAAIITLVAQRAEIEAAIASPLFTHARAGTGLWRDVRYIYHRDTESPTGVKLAIAGDAVIVEPLLRTLRQTSPLSPTEGR